VTKNLLGRNEEAVLPTSSSSKELAQTFSDFFIDKIDVRDGSSSSKHSFKSHVGIGSSSHDLLCDFEITFSNSSCDTGINSTSVSICVFGISSVVTAPIFVSVSELILSLIPSILSMKKSLKFCAGSFDHRSRK
jgi:hypothetical protein